MPPESLSYISMARLTKCVNILGELIIEEIKKGKSYCPPLLKKYTDNLELCGCTHQQSTAIV